MSVFRATWSGFALFGDLATMRLNVSAHSVDDPAIRQTIKEVYEQHGYIICPHTATECGFRKMSFPNPLRSW